MILMVVCGGQGDQIKLRIGDQADRFLPMTGTDLRSSGHPVRMVVNFSGDQRAAQALAVEETWAEDHKRPTTIPGKTLKIGAKELPLLVRSRWR